MKLEEVKFRAPAKEDGAKIWNLAKNVGGLDLNSQYFYILFSHHFSDTSIICEYQDKLVGFTVGYLVPNKPESYFVWQIGVDKESQGCSLGKNMILQLLQRDNCKTVKYVEATVTASNIASENLFRSIAKELEGDFSRSSLFSGDLFACGSHDAEDLIRVGPFSLNRN